MAAKSASFFKFFGGTRARIERWRTRFSRRNLGIWAVPIVTRAGVAMPGLLSRFARIWSYFQSEALPSPYRPASSLEVDIEAMLPPRPDGATRSVLFVHNSYYHFLHLAAALRRRGWDAVLVTVVSPGEKAQSLFHGEDAALYSNDPKLLEARIDAIRRLVPSRFRLVHFAGMHFMSLYPDNLDKMQWGRSVPWDFLEFKKRGAKIGYTITGCQDGIRQSVFKRHKDVCTRCVWETRPDVCSDARNKAWGKMLSTMCDLVAVEEDYAHEWRRRAFVYREPLTTALDQDYWRADLEVPDAFRLQRAEGELIVLHGFANAHIRRIDDRDIKGSDAIEAAMERLRSEGFRVRLVQPNNVPSKDMRFLQVQADVIVDQLNLGRYGAQAREGMMLGKPTVCHIDRREPQGVPELTCWDECPLIDATEATIYDVLKRLLSSPEERERIGRESRAYALKWHGADNAAERFERIYDRMMAGLPLNISEPEIFAVG